MFSAGEMEVVDWRSFDSLYFYNPFAAILFGEAPFAKAVRWSMLTDQIARTEAHLADLSVGTRVVTYEGFGGDMPDGYLLTHAEMIGNGQLALWIKQRSTRRARSKITGTIATAVRGRDHARRGASAGPARSASTMSQPKAGAAITNT